VIANTVHAGIIEDKIDQFLEQKSLPKTYKETALDWFIPLLERILMHHNKASRPIVVGVNGCQGSGKSTLTSLLVTLLNDVYQVNTVGFSIDDFYYSKQHRQMLAKNIHPLLATRGVPGTHDIDLLEKVLGDLTAGKPTLVPRFDKSIDDLSPMQDWPEVNKKVDIIILEGWCIGIDSQNPQALIEPVNDFEKTKDKNGKWREYVNDRLSTDYQRVFEQIDYLVMIKAPSFEQVFSWRWQQEQALANSAKLLNKSTHSSAIMSKEQIHDFIQFYQRLTTHALETLPMRCNTVFSLNDTRGIETCVHQ